jgi:hypothetical protein
MLIKTSSGFGLVQVMVASVLVGGIALTVSQLSKYSDESSRKLRDSATIASLRAQTSSMQENLQSWLNLLRSKAPTNAWAAACLNNNPSPTFLCPDNDATLNDPNLPSGAARSKVDLISAFGKPLAGGASPIYYDGTGGTCSGANNPSCRFAVTGYLIREVLDPNVNPRNVTFAIKIERINDKGEPPVRAAYEFINAFQEWSQPSPPDCNAGFLAKNSMGAMVCFKMGTCNDPKQMFSGWDTSLAGVTVAMKCVDVPPPVYAGFMCGATTFVKGFDGEGKAICY